MDKLRFDPRHFDDSVLRQLVLAWLRIGWDQIENSDYYGTTFIASFASVGDFVEPSPPLPHLRRDFMGAVKGFL
jgi:hypothetical protein